MNSLVSPKGLCIFTHQRVAPRFCARYPVLIVDPAIHCLRCLKAGTGTVDAPRAFSLKFAGVTQSDACGFKPSLHDDQFELLHNDAGQVECLLSKHVDDGNVAGLRKHLDNLVSQLEKTFGPITVHRTFTNVGVRQNRSADATITCGQDEYIKALKPISHKDLTGADPETPCTAELVSLFWSLLGAVAYALLTQHWLAVYVVALQRVTQEPRMIHIRRLNALVRKAQAVLARLVFKPMVCKRVIDCHSDSGFSEEQEKGYGIRGANIIRFGQGPTPGNNTSAPDVVHLLESVCRSHKHVTRSTFSRETLAAVAAADSMIPIAMTLHEVACGPISASQC